MPGLDCKWGDRFEVPNHSKRAKGQGTPTVNGPKKYIVQHYRGGGNCRRRKVAKDSCGRAGHRNGLHYTCS